MTRRRLYGNTGRFAHLLGQPAIYHDLAPGRRAGWHRQASALAGSTEEALCHRAARSSGRDPELAPEIAEVAAGHAGRGA